MARAIPAGLSAAGYNRRTWGTLVVKFVLVSWDWFCLGSGRMKSCLFSLFIVIAVASAAFSQAVSDPAKIEVYVTPYYDSKGPKIEVGTFSKGLAATNESEFVATIMQMKQSWKNLRFPEMYVAAIRLYDLGFRNEATYWFYSAQYQSRLFSLLVDQEKMGGMGAPAFELVQAGNAFQQLTGPYINGYAFGDLDRLSQIVGRVQNENKSVPELEKIYPGIAFKPPSAWDSDNSGLNEGLTRFLGMLKEQKASVRKQRKENGTEARFSKLASKELPAAP
jgi:hypothetical protein